MGVFFVILGGIFWAISGVLAEYLFKNHYSAEWVSFYRLLFTGVILIILGAKKFKLKLLKQKQELSSLLIFSIFGLLITQYGYFKAIFYTDAGTATMIQYNAPLIIMLFMCFKNKILPKKIELFALFLILFALFLLITNGDINALKLDIRGVIWAFFGALGVAFYSLSARLIIAKYGLFLIMGLASLIASFLLFVLLQGNIPKYDFSLNSFLAMGGIIFIGTIGAFGLYLKGVELIGPLRASMIACIEPVAAAFMSFLFLGTFYSLVDLLAFALIILSVFLNARKY
ncbi:DMT family transporter [Campylobacter peloridis]|uniref:DMT family transporter n=1 Tax=Campylobacter peloridis TaxID=488546 RepID=UPI001C734E10|nr:DMT family transporter [Campylobacter peloridis]MBX1886661.1 DMT family transporter [Campylobacter peloridis]